MELKDTIELMQSENYKERFKAEYYQAKIRYEKLKNFLEIEFNKEERKSAILLLVQQLNIMKMYIDILEQRSLTGNIDL